MNDDSIERAVGRADFGQFALAATSRDFIEAARSFLERRAPDFTGEHATVRRRPLRAR